MPSPTLESVCCAALRPAHWALDAFEGVSARLLLIKMGYYACDSVHINAEARSTRSEDLIFQFLSMKT